MNEQDNKHKGFFSSGKIWPMLIIAVLGTHVLGLFIVLVVINADPSFAVEEDYYSKAIDWNAFTLQRTLNEQLGWSVDIEIVQRTNDVESELLQITLTDAEGIPVSEASVTGLIYHMARSSAQTELQFGSLGKGVYAAGANLNRQGVWELRLLVEKDQDKFTNIARFNIGAGGRRVP